MHNKIFILLLAAFVLVLGFSQTQPTFAEEPTPTVGDPAATEPATDASESPVASPEVTAVPAPTEVPQEHGVVGDADCSGSVDPIDALQILRTDAGLVSLNPASEEYQCASLGDVHCGSEESASSLNAIDALAVLQYDATGESTITDGPCTIGEVIPDLSNGEVVAESPIYDDQGNFIGTVVDVISDVPPEGVLMPQASGYKYWWAETWIKNALGQKLAWIRHHQQFYYTGSRVTLYNPWESHGSMLGWDVNDIRNNGIGYSETRYTGWASHSATFKLKDPVFGWTIQSRGVYVGVTAYGSGYAQGWWG